MTATKSVSVRVATEGKAEIKRDMAEIGDAGKKAGDDTAKAFDKATDSVDRQRAAFEKIVAAQKMAASQAANQSSFNSILGVGPNGKSAADSAKYFQEVAALKAQQIGANFQSSLTQAFGIGQGFKSAADSASVFEKELDGLNGKSNMSNARFMALTAALRHSFDAMLAGRPPAQALAMEAGNLSFAFGEGGFAGLLNRIPSLLRALISPTALVIGGFAALAAGIGVWIAAERSAAADHRAFVESLSGIGRFSGASADGMETLAHQAAQTGDVTTAQARQIEQALARTGQIGFGSFSRLIGITERYAETTHEKFDQAKQEIADAFADPAKGADALNQKLGFLDDKTRQYIRSLLDQNRSEEARRALMDAMVPTLDKVGEHLDGLGRIGKEVSAIWDGVWEAIKQGGVDTTLPAQIAALQKERVDALQGRGSVTVMEGVPIQNAPRPIADIDADLKAVRAKQSAQAAMQATNEADGAARKYADTLGDLGRTVDADADAHARLGRTLQANIANFNNPAVRKHVADLQQAADGIDAQKHAYETWIPLAQKSAMLADLDTKAITARTPAQKAAIAADRERIQLAGQQITYSQANAQIQQASAKAYGGATREIQLQADALNASSQASINVARAYLQSSSAGMVAEARRQALTESARNGANVDARTAEILKDNIGKVTESAGKQVSALDFQSESQKRANDAVAAGAMTSEQAAQRMQVETALRPLIVAQTLAEGSAKAELADIIARLTKAYANDNAERARSRGQQAIEDQRTQIGLLQQQIGLLSLGDNAAQVQVAQLQAKAQLQRMNVSAASDEGQQIVANAGSLARLNQQWQRAVASRGELESAYDTLAGDFNNFLTQSDQGWDAFKNLGISALRDVGQEFLKLSALNPLRNLLFGGNAPTLGSVGGIFGSGGFGSLIASIFHGGGQAAQGAATRALPAAVFRGAPRFHNGVNLAPGEIPAILQEGERVLNRAENRAYSNDNRAGGGDLHIHQGDPTILVQGSVGPDEVAQIKQELRAINQNFERRVTAQFREINRRGGVK